MNSTPTRRLKPCFYERPDGWTETMRQLKSTGSWDLLSLNTRRRIQHKAIAEQKRRLQDEAINLYLRKEAAQ